MPQIQTVGTSVPFPPPLAYIAGMVLGFALHLLMPVRIAASARVASGLSLLGWGLLAVSAALVISAKISFQQAHTSHTFRKASTSLVVRGPFRISRNPVYVAGALVHCAVSLLANSLWPLLLLLPAVLLVNALISREEAYLASRFGGEYEAYRNRVRRWL